MTRPHYQTMSNYYSWQSQIYDATRWAFLFDRDTLLADLRLAEGETVVEVGCGTGRNLGGIVQCVGPRGKVLAVDCASPMVARCAARLRRNGWENIQLIEREYGGMPVTGGQADVVLMSYSLSMIPEWGRALECAVRDLRAGGRIGVVDFCLPSHSRAAMGFARWLAMNHVTLDRPYREALSSLFRPVRCVTRRAFGGLWSYYRFVGQVPE